MYDMKHIMRVESPALDVYSFGGVVWQIYVTVKYDCTVFLKIL